MSPKKRAIQPTDVPAAGPSRTGQTAIHGSAEPEMITIPSYGLEFFEHRRRLFLAGMPLPPPPSWPPAETYRVPPSPPPLPPKPYDPAAAPSIGRLEAALAKDGAEEDESVWRAVEGMAKSLKDGRRLTRGVRLGLMIRILRLTWLRDGTWPLDPSTSRAVRPPDSPPLLGIDEDSPIPSDAPTDTPPVPGLAGLMGYHGTPAERVVVPRVSPVRGGRVDDLRRGGHGNGNGNGSLDVDRTGDGDVRGDAGKSRSAGVTATARKRMQDGVITEATEGDTQQADHG